MATQEIITKETVETTTTTTIRTIEDVIMPPELVIIGKQAYCTSLQVAEHFEKNHKDVLRDIENAIRQVKTVNNPDMPADQMFVKGFDEALNNLGFKVKRPMYHLNADGFAFLGLGYTGDKAAKFKLAYMAAFKKMEAMLLNLSHPKPTTINGQQRLEMRNLVYSLTQFNVADEQVNHKVWNAIRFHWNLENVDDLPADQFPAVMQMLSGLQTHMKREFYPAFNQFLVEHMKKWLCGDADDTIQLKKKWYKLFQTELPQPINWKQVAQQLELKAA